MSLPAKLVHFLLAYAMVLFLAELLKRREARNHPDKAARYKALPLAYKLTCYFVVLPLFAGTVVLGDLAILGLVAFALLEGACVRWYRNAGLL